MDQRALVEQARQGDHDAFALLVHGANPDPIGYTRGDLVDAYLVWSPDGSRIAFLRYRGDAFGYAVVRLSDGHITPIDLPVSDDLASYGLASVEWSPDGTEILVIEHSGDQRALIVDPGTGRSRVIPSALDAPGSWVGHAIPNGTDMGSWQRIASP